MSFRTMTYVVFAPGVQFLGDAPKCLTGNIAAADKRGCLVVYESYLTPLQPDDFVGTGLSPDMVEELAVQQFLNTLPKDRFYLKRVGATCSTRGEFDAGLFGDEPDVEEIDAAFLVPVSGDA
ncbi:hypothetical protein [Burkholderia ubonensis]|uniref:Uncharacterized protein n=1 Tax=Burkholderia ubonensis subsp. mesacidophila TaxID=265293 RepID=A0A2A4F921_9BURK|nr:hypothetical protein [Burkholderia ubonensis]PCE30333.1 hypothetical protein BZL54_21825 [Burkholderia ubonensis subsp. mesacidophila]